MPDLVTDLQRMARGFRVGPVCDEDQLPNPQREPPAGERNANPEDVVSDTQEARAALRRTVERGRR